MKELEYKIILALVNIARRDVVLDAYEVTSDIKDRLFSKKGVVQFIDTEVYPSKNGVEIIDGSKSVTGSNIITVYGVFRTYLDIKGQMG